MKTHIIFSILFLFSCSLFSQNKIILKGKVLDENKSLIVFPVIANKTKNLGMMANSDGTFTMQIDKADTILFSSMGYYLQKVCLKDSLIKNDTFYLTVYLKKNIKTLKEVVVYDIKSINELQKQKDALGEKNTNTYQKVNALESPFTALYELFSKTERQKREIEKLENNDRRRVFLKELLRNYISYEILDMDDATLEDFIDFMGLKDEYIKSVNDYDLAAYITAAFERYKRYKAKGGM